MSLIDEWSRRRMSQQRQGRIEFLGEQSGSLEDDLKRALILEFATRPPIQRAYFSRVGGESETPPAAALCIVSTQPDDYALVTRILDILSRRFAKDALPDVLFLTPEQEVEVKRVSQPFYGRVAS